MSDDVASRSSEGRYKIILNKEDDVHYWANRLGVTADQLHKAIEAVGDGVEAVTHYLKACGNA